MVNFLTSLSLALVEEVTLLARSTILSKIKTSASLVLRLEEKVIGNKLTPFASIFLHVYAGIDGDRHSATLSMGQPGVLHGVRTYILQSKEGQIIETHSISAGLDYPGVGPEHAWLKDSGRAEYVVATDEEALRGFRMLTQREGIIPGNYFFFVIARYDLNGGLIALESSHAIWEAVRLAKSLPKDQDLVVVSHVDLHLSKISDLHFSASLDGETRTSNKFLSFSLSGLTYLTGTFLHTPSSIVVREFQSCRYPFVARSTRLETSRL